MIQSTVTSWSFDNDERHVTAFRPISEAAPSWSYDKSLCSAFYGGCKHNTAHICCCGLAVQQSIDISCLSGPQQQTCRMLQQSTARRTGGWTLYCCIDPAIWVVSIVFFITLISKLHTSCCMNCLYLYEPVMLSTVPCLHWRYLSVHCLDTLWLWLLSFQFCFWLYCIACSTVNF